MRRLGLILLAMGGLLLLSAPLRAVPLEKAPEAAATTPATPAPSAEPGPEEHLPLKAGRFVDNDFLISNSMVVCWIVALGLIVFAQAATRNLQTVPSGAQNLWEWMVEELYNFLESIIGPELVQKTFWFLATIFLFILFTNWFGLVPGVGSIGWGVAGEHGFRVTQPLLRGGNADLNMTFGMAMVFFFLWTVWAVQYNGLKGFLLHLFGPKGESSGWLRVFMIVVFALVGILEIVSILFRPISLSLRLFGNIYAGENMLESMFRLVPGLGWLLPIPFYFMELLVGLVQALVFMLLTAVFVLLICQHEEGHGKAAHPEASA
jgi:F-type H+-transporting ATPase subunit a